MPKMKSKRSLMSTSTIWIFWTRVAKMRSFLCCCAYLVGTKNRHECGSITPVGSYSWCPWTKASQYLILSWTSKLWKSQSRFDQSNDRNVNGWGVAPTPSTKLNSPYAVPQIPCLVFRWGYDNGQQYHQLYQYGWKVHK